MKTGYDAAYPPPSPPATDVVCIYCGGDTVHVWTIQEIQAQPARYRLPIWVRSNPGQASALTDAQEFLTQLKSIGCPMGATTVLDLETAIDSDFVNAFGATMHAGGFFVLVYGSSSTLYSNPPLDGFFVAKPGATSIPVYNVGVQFAFDVANGAYDLDLFADEVALWDTAPLPPPPPPTPNPSPEDHVTPYNVDVVIKNGGGWLASPQFVGQLCGVFVEGGNPDVTHTYNTTVPHFVSIGSQPGGNSPNGDIEFAGPSDGTFGVLLQFYS